MGLVVIRIERHDKTDKRHYEAQLDCTDQQGEDSPEYVGMMLSEALEALFGGEGDLFNSYDIVMHTLSFLKPKHNEFPVGDGVYDFFQRLSQAWADWEGSEDPVPFSQHFRTFREENP
jgi:hypothetical protein